MKRFVIALVILALIITAGVLESVHVERTFGELDKRIAALEDAIKSPTDDALDEGLRRLTRFVATI